MKPVAMDMTNQRQKTTPAENNNPSSATEFLSSLAPRGAENEVGAQTSGKMAFSNQVRTNNFNVSGNNPDSSAGDNNSSLEIGSVSVSVSTSTPSTDNLLPTHQPTTSSTSWSSYAMPIYSSLGVDILGNYPIESDSTILGKRNSSPKMAPNQLSNTSGKNSDDSINDDRKLVAPFAGGNLIDRFNQGGSGNAPLSTVPSIGNNFDGDVLCDAKFSCKGESSISMSNRTYTSVLNSPDSLQNRLSMLSIQQPQRQSTTAHQIDTSDFKPVLGSNSNNFSQSNLNTACQSRPSIFAQYQQQHRLQPYHLRQASDSVLPNQYFHQAYQQQHNVDGVLAGGNPRNSSGFSRTLVNNFIDKPIAGHGKRRNKLPFFTGAPATGASSSAGGSGGGYTGVTGNALFTSDEGSLKVDRYGNSLVNSDGSERFSRKVFVGGLPPDIDEEEIKASFRRFGSLAVDWPHKAESRSYFPPKGYAFLLFQEESSVQALIDACLQEEDKLYLCVSSPTIKDKPVQIRPWRLSDADYVLDLTLALDPRKTVFVGGVPRPLKASELATIMNNLYGGVCYAGIDTDPELKYPKGAGRVAFSNHQSYIAAISARFVHLHHSELEKRVEVKPYVLDDQSCDECFGARCNDKFAPFFCSNITCLRYYCENCWSMIHSQPGKEFHKPLVKEGADRPRGAGGGTSSSGSGSGSGSGGGVSSSSTSHRWC